MRDIGSLTAGTKGSMYGTSLKEGTIGKYGKAGIRSGTWGEKLSSTKLGYTEDIEEKRLEISSKREQAALDIARERESYVSDLGDVYSAYLQQYPDQVGTADDIMGCYQEGGSWIEGQCELYE